MLRIQLAIEDYSELIGLQTMLKKVGFDVDATQNAVGLSDQLLKFNPDLVIMTGYGRKVAGFEFAKQMRRVRGLPHVVLLHDPSQTPEADPAVEAWHPMPVDPSRLLGIIAVIAKLNEKVLLEKFRRFVDQQRAEAPGHVIVKGEASSASSSSRENQASSTSSSSGTLAASTLAEDARRARYKEFLKDKKDAAPTAHGFAQKQVREQVKALRQAETTESNADLEKERREFVAQLFKKA